MIGAIQSTGVNLEAISRASAAPLQVETQAATAPETPTLTDQVTDLLESREAAENAIVQAQITIFKEGLDISKSMALQMLKMLEGTQLLAKSASTAAQSPSSLDIVA